MKCYLGMIYSICSYPLSESELDTNKQMHLKLAKRRANQQSWFGQTFDQMDTFSLDAWPVDFFIYLPPGLVTHKDIIGPCSLYDEGKPWIRGWSNEQQLINSNCFVIQVAHHKQRLTHSLERGILVEILDRVLLFIGAGDLSHS